MKAESIEQIREHLARGGRVLHEDEKIGRWEIVDAMIEGFKCIANGVSIFLENNTVKPDGWELLPLDEKPTRQYYYRVNGCLAEDSSSETCMCWHDEGTGPLRDHPEEIGRWREKPLPGVPASSLPLVAEDPTGGQAMTWRDVAGTLQINTGPLYHRKLQILINGNDTGAGERIRKALLFGHLPSMPDLLSWWEATTGERIEHGRRCDECGGDGKSREKRQHGIYYGYSDCSECAGRGYTVRPTWMGER